VRLTSAELSREAAATGFLTESLEKVIILIELLEAIRSHPFLKDRVALKGGTALNLFVFDIPRLSVDIDLNYIGAVERDEMIADRPRVELAMQAVCGRLDLRFRHMPDEHAGGKWRLSYRRADGGTGALEVDINYILRVPLWPVSHVDSRPIGSFAATRVPLLDIHELAAGKLAALLARSAGRDLFDASLLRHIDSLDTAKLRLAFAVYGGINRKDWRTVSIDDVTANSGDIERTVLPLLRGREAPSRTSVAAWTQALVSDCRDLLSRVLPFAPRELEFLTRLNEHGEVLPELLTENEQLRKAIRSQPGLRWKAMNVQRHRGNDSGHSASQR
jgi:predicted nucleotidyltransferase component of viral defense system